jgi:hypothetical protein
VANRIVKKFAMKDMRELVGDLSQTNYYMLSFSTLNSTLMSYIQSRVGFAEDTRNFLSRKTGLLCSEASLPTSSFATGEVRDNFMGIPQEFAHTRLYTDIDFTFYVDSNYVNLKIFESWMDYISGGSEAEISELNEDYYRRMRYPDTYKVQTMFISKFERDFNSQIDYQFINAFPKLVTAIPVSYGAADLLKVSVQFTYDRYIVNPRGSIRKSNTSGFNDITRVANDSTVSDKIVSSSSGKGPIELQVQPFGESFYDPFEPVAPPANPTATATEAVRQRSAGSQVQMTERPPYEQPFDRPGDQSAESAAAKQEAAKLRNYQETQRKAAELKADIDARQKMFGTPF